MKLLCSYVMHGARYTLSTFDPKLQLRHGAGCFKISIFSLFWLVCGRTHLIRACYERSYFWYIHISIFLCYCIILYQICQSWPGWIFDAWTIWNKCYIRYKYQLVHLFFCCWFLIISCGDQCFHYAPVNPSDAVSRCLLSSKKFWVLL